MWSCFHIRMKYFVSGCHHLICVFDTHSELSYWGPPPGGGLWIRTCGEASMARGHLDCKYWEFMRNIQSWVWAKAVLCWSSSGIILRVLLLPRPSGSWWAVVLNLQQSQEKRGYLFLPHRQQCKPSNSPGVITSGPGVITLGAAHSAPNTSTFIS